jgi:hypothetical protein
MVEGTPLKELKRRSEKEVKLHVLQELALLLHLYSAIV